MTQFLSTLDVSRIIASRGIAHALRGMAGYIEDDFRRWQEFDKSARSASHSPVGVIELMPTADASLYSFKYVNGHPGNTRIGLPTVMAFGVLASVETGMPLLLSELTLTTALRTAATSVMAARRLARADATTMALVGNGAQSEFQALAFYHLLGIRRIQAYDVDPAATAKLRRNLADVPGLEFRVCASTAEAVRGADIVTTVTADKAYATIITPEMLEPGMHLNAVGGDCPGKTELHPDVLRRASVFVEYEPQSRIEGDVQQMPADFAVTEFWRVLAGQVPGRRDAGEITVFDSVGFALEDFSALRYLRDQAEALRIGDRTALIPALDDPKNLFSQLSLATPQASVRAAAPVHPVH
ncbi:ornithine cyclodeaminase [Cupriavidus sp. YR651]|uniref:ornithine cyclodeaminase n=1 Tax=Cupriavidus sp. YR651 TaxID=1855315 RepID=UPI00087F4223|nr:ornithine cyclodeaminase [Cupriavidus sp. YR651]SDB98025.1 ornithine cyclodeaminase [Cupriavidus sp. YR651]